MSDNPKKGDDLTRIEDLSEYLHEADEGDDFQGLSTDPDLSLPDDFNSTEEADYSALEEDLDNIEPGSITDNFDDNEDEFENDFEEVSEDTSEDNFQDDFSDNSFDDDATDSESFGDESFEDSTFGDDSDSPQSESFEDSSFEGDSFEDNSFEDSSFEDETVNQDQEDDFSTSFESEDDLQASPSETDDSSKSDLASLDDSQDDVITDEQIKEDQEDFSQQPDTMESAVTKKPISPSPIDIPKTEYKAPENFRDLQRFAKNMSYGNLSHEGTPPFSIVLKDIKYQEDLDDIVILLKEFKILNEEDETSARQTLSRGSFLIPRLSEYAAILLCHKLRRFELTILMGLTEEINPAKTYSSDDSGMATKNNIFNNRSHNFIFENENIRVDDVITSTTQSLEGYEIKDYIAVVTDHSIVTSEELTSEDADISDHLYQDLVTKLKYAAIDKKGNGVVGINYTMVPLLKESAADKNQYKIICTGNVVWLIKK